MKDFEFERAMVVFAHPDDAEVQCAGTIARWVEEGKKITYVVMTGGDKGTQDPAMTPEALAKTRREEQLAAAAALGVDKVVFLENPDGELEVNLERRREVTRIIREYQPQVLITHDPWMRYQMHPDHRASGTLALDAAISSRDRLYFYDQIQAGLAPCRIRRALLFASDEADYWVDISSTLDKKMKALSLHRSQVAQWKNWEEWLRKRAETQAESHGMKYAEAFKRLILN